MSKLLPGADEAAARAAAPAGERRWPMAVAVLTAALLLLVAPEAGRLLPRWVVPMFEIALLAILVAGDPGRIDRRSRRIRQVANVLIAVMTAAMLVDVAVLIVGILWAIKGGASSAASLFGRGAALWVTNVIVFSLWYWQFDHGGPAERAAGAHVSPSFMFPENANPDVARSGWVPTYPDYLYLAFTNATAFSPTDTLPVRTWAKMTMLLESMISLITAIVVIARAVNILPTWSPVTKLMTGVRPRRCVFLGLESPVLGRFRALLEKPEVADQRPLPSCQRSTPVRTFGSAESRSSRSERHRRAGSIEVRPVRELSV